MSGMTVLPATSVSRRGSAALTSLAPLSYYRKVTENSRREEKGCLTADEPWRQPTEGPTPTKRKVLTEVAAMRLMEKENLTTTVSSFAKRLLSCRVLMSTVGICGMTGRGRGGFLLLYGNTRPSVMSCPSSRWITWLSFRSGRCPSVGRTPTLAALHRGWNQPTRGEAALLFTISAQFGLRWRRFGITG